MTAQRRNILIAVVAAVILLIGAGCYFFTHRDRWIIPNEKEAGVALLAEKLTGPGYFHQVDTASEFSQGEGGPWIAPGSALDQVDRIVRERKFDRVRTEKLKRLIGKLTEPHPSRVVGGERIQLVRLNLALDQLKE